MDSVSAYCAGGLSIESRPTSVTCIGNMIGCYAGCQEVGRYHTRGAETSTVHCVQVRKHTGKGSTLALKPRADITRSQKQGYQWPHKKNSCHSKKFKKKKNLTFSCCRAFFKASLIN